MKQLLKIIGTHKRTLQKQEMKFKSIEQAAFFNPDFKDFEIVGPVYEGETLQEVILNQQARKIDSLCNQVYGNEEELQQIADESFKEQNESNAEEMFGGIHCEEY